MNRELEYTVFRDYNKVHLKEAEEYLETNMSKIAALKEKIDKTNKTINIVENWGCLFNLLVYFGTVVYFIYLVLFGDFQKQENNVFLFISAIMGISVIRLFVKEILDRHFKHTENQKKFEEISKEYRCYEKYIAHIKELKDFVILSVKMVEGRIYVIYKEPAEVKILVREFNKKNVVVAEDKDIIEVHLYCDKYFSSCITKIVVPYGIV